MDADRFKAPASGTMIEMRVTSWIPEIGLDDGEIGIGWWGAAAIGYSAAAALTFFPVATS